MAYDKLFKAILTRREKHINYIIKILKNMRWNIPVESS